MAWPGYDMFQPSPPLVVNDRVGRRGRGQHLYYTDGSAFREAGPHRLSSITPSTTISLRLVPRGVDKDPASVPQPTMTTIGMIGPIAPAGIAIAREIGRGIALGIALGIGRGVDPDLTQEPGPATARTKDTEGTLTPIIMNRLDQEIQRKLQKYDEFKRKEEEEAARERLKQEALLAKAKEAAKKKEEEEFRKRVIADVEREKFEKEMKEKRKKEEEDRIFKARFREFYLTKGYSEESIEALFNAEKKKKKEKGHKDHSPHSPHGADDQQVAVVKVKEMNVVNLASPTHIKVHRKYLSPETLDAYDLPWEWYDQDSNYIVIKQWINQTYQDKLFEHTRKLRERREPKLLTAAPVELKKDANGKMKLVRDRSPLGVRSRSRPRSWMFT
ncbi:MAG: hypothetical protein Q9178_004102 [Gyalolechia marmorata]